MIRRMIRRRRRRGGGEEGEKEGEGEGDANVKGATSWHCGARAFIRSPKWAYQQPTATHVGNGTALVRVGQQTTAAQQQGLLLVRYGHLLPQVVQVGPARPPVLHHTK
jgi:hypothetical protein